MSKQKFIASDNASYVDIILPPPTARVGKPTSDCLCLSISYHTGIIKPTSISFIYQNLCLLILLRHTKKLCLAELFSFSFLCLSLSLRSFLYLRFSSQARLHIFFSSFSFRHIQQVSFIVCQISFCHFQSIQHFHICHVHPQACPIAQYQPHFSGSVVHHMMNVPIVYVADI